MVGIMKRILIVYDTIGGSTWEIVGWIREGAASVGAIVDVLPVKKVRSLDYDLIAIGSPIYSEKPMDTIKAFLGDDRLSGKKVALFIVCFAGVFGRRNFMVRRYMEEIKDHCKGIVVTETSFDAASGPWRKLNRAICFDFGMELAKQSFTREKAMETA